MQVAAAEIIEHPFNEVKKKVKYLCRSCKYVDAQETIQKYIDEMEKQSIEELS